MAHTVLTLPYRDETWGAIMASLEARAAAKVSSSSCVMLALLLSCPTWAANLAAWELPASGLPVLGWLGTRMSEVAGA